MNQRLSFYERPGINYFTFCRIHRSCLGILWSQPPWQCSNEVLFTTTWVSYTFILWIFFFAFSLNYLKTSKNSKYYSYLAHGSYKNKQCLQWGWPCPKFHVCSRQNHKDSLVAVQNMGPVARFDLHILVLTIITYTELNLLRWNQGSCLHKASSNTWKSSMRCHGAQGTIKKQWMLLPLSLSLYSGLHFNQFSF